MDKDKLFTWKEIADYLDCNPRTCRRWEKKYCLPVRRIDGSSSLRVFAEKNEIDEWVEKRSNKRNKSKLEFLKRLNRKKVFYLLLLTIIASLICLLILIAPSNFITFNPAQPFDFKIEKSKLVILDEKGNFLWDYDTKLGNLVDENDYRDHFQNKMPNLNSRNELPHIIIKDIDGDNINEIIFSIQTLNEIDEGKLYCFNHKGVSLWSFAAGKEMKYGSKTFSSDYRIKGFDLCDFNHDGKFEILVIAHQNYRFPAQVVLLSYKGECLGEYWNSGYLIDYEFIDLDNNGIKEIVLVGANNEYGKGSLIVLKPESIKGGSPQNNNEYKCKDIEPGSELYYVLFPRTDLDLLERVQINSIYKIKILENQRICVELTCAYNAYELNFNLKPLFVTLSHKFKQMHDKARAENKIKSKLNEEYEEILLNGILYWDGQNWVSTPTMNSYWKNKAIYQ